MIRPLRLASLLLLALQAWSAPAGAAPPPPRPAPVAVQRPVPRSVQLKLLVVAATDSHAGVDPRLAPLAKHLRFLRYSGYDLLDSHLVSLSTGSQTSFNLRGGHRVTVQLKQVTSQKAQFRVQIYNQKGKLLDTTLSVNRNGTFIVAGPHYRDGILILPLQVRY